MSPRSAWPSVLTALVALASACRTDCTPRGATQPPNVILVTVDTLRADHLGCYGNPTVKTPNFDRLALEGRLFERCWSAAEVTVPSHLAILSSLPLSEHGLFQNDGQVPRRVDLLPGLFARAGYRTGAFVSAKHLGPDWTLGPLLTGLDAYHAPRRMSVQLPAEETNQELFRWLHGTCRDPFFAWVHYWEPHMPYLPPPPFDTAYYHGDPRDPQKPGMNGVILSWYFHELDGVRRRLSKRATEVRQLKRDLGLRSREVRKLVFYPQDLGRFTSDPRAQEGLRHRLEGLATFVRTDLPYRHGLADFLTGVRDVDYPRALYAGEVSYLDLELGRLREELERLGLAGRTVVVVTADHGESLGEHGLWFTHYGLHEPNLRVPLIVWAPGRVAPGRESRPVRGVDVAPTVLRLAGLEPPAPMRGRDLLGDGATSEPVVSESLRQQQIAIVDGRWKLIRNLQTFYYVPAFAKDAGTVELYDLQSDPGEQRNLAATEPDVARDLGARLDAWQATHHAPVDGHAGTLTPEQREQLRALGYAE